MQTNSRIQKKTKLKKDWNNHLETTKTKLSNKKSYIYWFLFSFKSRDIFGTTTFQNQTKLVQIDGSKQNQEKKHDKNVRYDNFNAFYVWRMSMQRVRTGSRAGDHLQPIEPFPVFLAHQKNKVESKKRQIEI